MQDNCFRAEVVLRLRGVGSHPLCYAIGDIPYSPDAHGWFPGSTKTSITAGHFHNHNQLDHHTNDLSTTEFDLESREYTGRGCVSYPGYCTEHAGEFCQDQPRTTPDNNCEGVLLE